MKFQYVISPPFLNRNINIFEFNGVNVAKHWHVAGEVFAISDCLVLLMFGQHFELVFKNQWTHQGPWPFYLYVAVSVICCVHEQLCHYYLAPGGGCDVLFSPCLSVCLSVCLYVCLCVCPANILVFYFSAIRRDIDLKFIHDTYRVVLN